MKMKTDEFENYIDRNSPISLRFQFSYLICCKMFHNAAEFLDFNRLGEVLFLSGFGSS